MSDLFQITKTFIEQYPVLITGGGVVLLLLLALFLQRTALKEVIAERKLNKLLKNSGKASMHNIIIPDAIDGNIFIEHLILMPKEIIILGVKKYQGLIFAADKIDLWTQVIGNKSYKFENPLHHIEANVVALKNIIEKSEIGKKVLFIQGSDFPKGKPDNIVSIDDIKKWNRKELNENIPAALQLDWEKLVALAVEDDISTEKNKMKSLKRYLFTFIALFIAILIWLYVRTV